MGFVAFLGRVMFASLFILSAWQAFIEFDDPNGGSAGNAWAPKVAMIQEFSNSKLGEGSLNLNVKHFVAASIVLNGLGGLLFVFSSNLGAFLLMTYLWYSTPLFYDFYNCKTGSPEFFQLLQGFLQRCAYFGALLFFIGMKNSILRKQKRKSHSKAKAA